MSRVLAKFLKEWREKERKGEVSGLDRMEVIALELYDQWLVEEGYYDHQVKEVEK